MCYRSEINTHIIVLNYSCNIVRNKYSSERVTHVADDNSRVHTVNLSVHVGRARPVSRGLYTSASTWHVLTDSGQLAFCASHKFLLFLNLSVGLFCQQQRTNNIQKQHKYSVDWIQRKKKMSCNEKEMIHTPVTN